MLKSGGDYYASKNITTTNMTTENLITTIMTHPTAMKPIKIPMMPMMAHCDNSYTSILCLVILNQSVLFHTYNQKDIPDNQDNFMSTTTNMTSMSGYISNI